MVQDRRKHRRFKSSHPAQLLVGGATPIDCQINNFSRGGLSLSVGREALRAVPCSGSPDASPAVDAEVLVWPDEGGAEYRIPVHIVFASDQGVGAAFLRPDQQVIDYLLRSAVVRKQVWPEVRRSRSCARPRRC